MSKRFPKILTVIFIFQLAILNAQNIVNPRPEKNVPLAVSQAFNQKFPSHDPVWFSQYNGRYDQRLVFEGRFIFDKRYSSAIYDNEGNMLAFAAAVEKSELPKKAMDYMDQKYPSFPIIDALLLTRGKDKVTYEIGIFIDKQYVIQVFNEAGDFIKSTKA